MSDIKVINKPSDSTEDFLGRLKEYKFNNIDKEGVNLILLAVMSIDSLLDRLNEQVDRNTDLNLAFDKAFEYLKESHIERDSTVEDLRNKSLADRKIYHKEQIELLENLNKAQKGTVDIIKANDKQMASLQLEKENMEKTLSRKIADEAKPRRAGTETLRRRAQLWQHYIDSSVRKYVDDNPHLFANKEDKLNSKDLGRLERFVGSQLDEVRDPKLESRRSKKNPAVYSPPQTLKPKIKDALTRILAE